MRVMQHSVATWIYEIQVATVYFQAIVQALIIMTKETITQQPYQGKAVLTIKTRLNLDCKKCQVLLAAQGISPWLHSWSTDSMNSVVFRISSFFELSSFCGTCKASVCSVASGSTHSEMANTKKLSAENDSVLCCYRTLSFSLPGSRKGL